MSLEPDQKSSRLLLIGTHHDDPRGYERLLTGLYNFNPTVVTVEAPRDCRTVLDTDINVRIALWHDMSTLFWQGNDRARYRRAIGRTNGYEIRAARDYAQAWDREWRAVDTYHRAPLNPRAYTNLIRGNVSFVASGERNIAKYQEMIDQTYDLFMRCITQPDLIPQRERYEYKQSKKSFVGRNRAMAKHIERGLAYPRARVAHIGGISHLVDYGDGSLLTLLAHHGPQIAAASQLSSADPKPDPRADAYKGRF